MVRRPKSKSVTLIQACLLTGTLDALAALLISHSIPAAVIFKFIASGWFGRQALRGGAPMVLWGLIFHYLIAAFFTIVLFLIYPRVIKVLKNQYLVGVVYGLGIWLFMNFIILPFSNIPKSHAHLELISLVEGIAALIICLGIPVALLAEAELAGGAPDRPE